MASFTEGLVEGMVTAFSKFSYLHVIALSSSRQYTGGTVDARVAGDELGARYVLEGSLRKAGDDIRLSMQLVDVTGGTHLWAETYGRSVAGTGLFELQDELTEKIVSTVADMHGVLLRSMIELVRRKAPDSLTPYEAVLLAYAYWQTMYVEEHAVARACLERAVEVAPHNSDAWACLAHMYIEEYKQSHNPLPDSVGRAIGAARRAIDLDSSNSLAFDALAQASYFGGDLSAFRTAAERAIALNPLAGYTTAFMGQLIAQTGEWDRGLTYTRRAMNLNPHHPGWYHFAPFWNHYRLGEYAEALDAIQKVNMPGYYWTHVALAAVNGQLGREKAASTAVREAVALLPDVGKQIEDDLVKWRLWDSLGPSFVEGLKKAGLEVAEPVEGAAPHRVHTSSDPSAGAEPKASSDASGGDVVAPEPSESIAVLPFTDMSAARDQDYFCEGMAEEILNALAGVGDEVLLRATEAAL